MSAYRIQLNGCDDITYLDNVTLTDEQYAVVAHLADLSRAASDYGCMPTLSIQPQPEVTA